MGNSPFLRAYALSLQALFRRSTVAILVDSSSAYTRLVENSEAPLETTLALEQTRAYVGAVCTALTVCQRVSGSMYQQVQRGGAWPVGYKHFDTTTWERVAAGDLLVPTKEASDVRVIQATAHVLGGRAARSLSTQIVQKADEAERNYPLLDAAFEVLQQAQALLGVQRLDDGRWALFGEALVEVVDTGTVSSSQAMAYHRLLLSLTEENHEVWRLLTPVDLHSHMKILPSC